MRALSVFLLLSLAVVCVSGSPFGFWGSWGWGSHHPMSYGGYYGGKSFSPFHSYYQPSYPSKKTPHYQYQAIKKQPPPPQPKKLPTITRQQVIKQHVIQPVVHTQPVLQVHHVTQNVYKPTLQKQPVIQRVITQPVIHRVVHNQPIIQQQLQQQTVVKRRVIHQPRIVQHMKTQFEQAPTLTKTMTGADYPTQTIHNPKIPQQQQYMTDDGNGNGNGNGDGNGNGNGNGNGGGNGDSE